ncbi:MAG: hypothetical protein KC502_11665 [Myxococcales bacterium]|nr:hypothetical protein [Myxococcales bacterium]
MQPHLTSSETAFTPETLRRRRFARGLAHALSATLMLLTASACVSPLMHPIRAPDGPYLRVGAGMGVGGGDRALCDIQCTKADPGTTLGFAGAVAVGLGHRLSPQHGALIGVTIAAPTVNPVDDLANIEAMEYVALDLWTDWTPGAVADVPLTFGAGVSVSFFTVTPEVGIHGRFFGDSSQDGVSIWARAPVPFVARDDVERSLVSPAHIGEAPSPRDVRSKPNATVALGGRSPLLQAGISGQWRGFGVHWTMIRRLAGAMEVPFGGKAREHVNWLSVIALSYDDW